MVGEDGECNRFENLGNGHRSCEIIHRLKGSTQQTGENYNSRRKEWSFNCKWQWEYIGFQTKLLSIGMRIKEKGSNRNDYAGTLMIGSQHETHADFYGVDTYCMYVIKQTCKRKCK